MDWEPTISSFITAPSMEGGWCDRVREREREREREEKNILRIQIPCLHPISVLSYCIFSLLLLTVLNWFNKLCVYYFHQLWSVNFSVLYLLGLWDSLPDSDNGHREAALWYDLSGEELRSLANSRVNNLGVEPSRPRLFFSLSIGWLQPRPTSWLQPHSRPWSRTTH